MNDTKDIYEGMSEEELAAQAAEQEAGRKAVQQAEAEAGRSADLPSRPHIRSRLRSQIASAHHER